MGARKKITYRVSGSGCWLCTSHVSSSTGYVQFYINGRQIHGHRHFYQLYKGPIPAGLWVLHRCDNPRCINPDHLFLGTNQDNVADKCRKHRHAFGERNGVARLTEQQAREIKASSEDRRILAHRYGVDEWTVRDILKGRSWKHVQVAS